MKDKCSDNRRVIDCEQCETKHWNDVPCPRRASAWDTHDSEETVYEEHFQLAVRETWGGDWHLDG